MTYKAQGVVLGTFDLRRREFDCHRWTGIDSAPPKRGNNRTLPGVRGSSVRPRVGSDLYGQLHVHIRGQWAGNNPRGGNLATWREAALENLATFLGVVDADSPLTLTLHRAGALPALTGTVQIDDPGPVAWLLPHHAHMVIGVTLPNGRMVPA